MSVTAHSQTATVSTVTVRRRGLSLSLVGKQTPSLLHGLPAEIIIHILELALLNDRPRDLALISRIIKQFINIIIYRVVVLDNSQTVALFYRTASSPRSSHLLTHVKRLAITWEPEYFTPDIKEQLRHIVAGCTSLRALAAPSCCQISSSVALQHDGPTDLTIETFEGQCDDGSFALPLLSTHSSTALTHLRICEPSRTWQSPLSIIASFHYASNLTHLQLARRADSNEDNDIVFAEDIMYLLSTRKELKMVVVSIFSGLSGVTPTSVQESSIWALISKIREADARVVLVAGKFGEWKEEWENTKGLRCAGQPLDFWDTIQSRQTSDIEAEEVDSEHEGPGEEMILD